MFRLSYGLCEAISWGHCCQTWIEAPLFVLRVYMTSWGFLRWPTRYFFTIKMSLQPQCSNQTYYPLAWLFQVLLVYFLLLCIVWQTGCAFCPMLPPTGHPWYYHRHMVCGRRLVMSEEIYFTICVVCCVGHLEYTTPYKRSQNAWKVHTHQVRSRSHFKNTLRC